MMKMKHNLAHGSCNITPEGLQKTTDPSKVCTTICKFDGKTTGAARTADQDDSDDDDEPEDAEPEGDLMIGDSLIRDVIPTQESLMVDSTSGATLSAIRKKIKSVNPRKKRCQRIFIIAGTNDTSSKCPVNKITNDCKSTIQAAKKIGQVFMSSVPPRADNRADSNKINTVNQLFCTVSNEEDATFINNDDNFHFRDNTVNSNLLLPDQHHLSSNGVKKLLSNLSLSNKAKPRISH